MPTFRVFITQLVEQVATLDIEAADPVQARAKALETDPGVTAEWREGDYAEDVEVYCIAAADGTVIWERE